jgi:aryl-alcohol dehydrogenase-like predicted oxidoreductase
MKQAYDLGINFFDTAEAYVWLQPPQNTADG